MEKLQPKLRFPEFNGNWERKKLREVSDVYDGTHQTPKYVSEGVKFVSVENINDLINTDKFISKKAFEKDFKVKPKKGDILMTRITAGVIGATAVVDNDEDLAYYVSLGLIRLKNNGNPFFYSQNIQSFSFRNELHRRIIHVAFPKKINLGDLQDCNIYNCSFEEQTRIANFLSSVDEKINLLKEKKSLLEEYKKGIMQKIFNQEIRFKDDNGNDFEDWDERTLGELLSIPEKLKPENINTDKLLTVKLHLKGVQKNTNTESLSIGSTNYIIRKKGQFIYGKQNLFNGAFGIIPDEFDGFLSSGDVPALDVNQNKVNSTFLLSYFSRKEFYNNLENIATGSGSKRIHEKILLSLDISLPCLQEQTKIANFLSAIDEKIVLVSNQIQDTQEYKKGLLQQMFV